MMNTQTFNREQLVADFTETEIAEAEAELRALMAEHPHLTAFGHMPPYRRRKSGWSEERFERERDELLLPEYVRGYIASKRFLGFRQPSCGRPRWCGSYGLKHAVESTMRKAGRQQYVPNGALIAAALQLGFPTKEDSPNMFVKVRMLRSVERELLRKWEWEREREWGTAA